MRRTSRHSVSSSDGAFDADIEWIDTTGAVERLVAAAIEAGEYAIDTEFHREQTYYPTLALVQVCIRAGDGSRPVLALIDPFAVDMHAFAPLFTASATAIVHAARQDLEVFVQDVGIVPSSIYDTQIAAGFVGMGSPSLTSLVADTCNITLAKGDRMTDWLRRPLSVQQQQYAANDVRYLHAVATAQRAELHALGRMAWVHEACEELRTTPITRPTPDTAWRGFSAAKQLRGPALGALIEVAAWRERRAQQRNLPPRRILGDVVVETIAQRMPDSIDDLREIRGFTLRNERDCAELLAAVAAGRSTVPPPAAPRRPAADPHVVALVSAWVGEVARSARIDRALLATRDDIEAFAAGVASPITASWRAALLGDGPTRLQAGTAALAVDGNGGLRLIECT